MPNYLLKIYQYTLTTVVCQCMWSNLQQCKDYVKLKTLEIQQRKK